MPLPAPVITAILPFSLPMLSSACDRFRGTLTPVECRGDGLPDLAHAALAQEGGHGVVTEAGAGTESHRGMETAHYTEAKEHRSSTRRRHPSPVSPRSARLT